MDDDEILVEKSPIYLYNIPARIQKRDGYLHRASDWDVGNPDWTGKIALVAAGPGCCHLQLEDNSGDIFAQAVIESYPTPVVQAVIDSRRFFVLKIQKKSGDFELAGIGYSTRDDSRDFIDILEEYFLKPTPTPPQKRPACPLKIDCLQPVTKKTKSDNGNPGLPKASPAKSKSSNGDSSAGTSNLMTCEVSSNKNSAKQQAGKGVGPKASTMGSAEDTKKVEFQIDRSEHSNPTEPSRNKSVPAKTGKKVLHQPKSIMKSDNTSGVARPEVTASSTHSAESKNVSETEVATIDVASDGDVAKSKVSDTQNPHIGEIKTGSATEKCSQKIAPITLSLSGTDTKPSPEKNPPDNETLPSISTENVTVALAEKILADEKLHHTEEQVSVRSAAAEKLPETISAIEKGTESTSTAANPSEEDDRTGLENQVSFDIPDTGEDEIDTTDLNSLEATIDPLSIDSVSLVNKLESGKMLSRVDTSTTNIIVEQAHAPSGGLAIEETKITDTPVEDRMEMDTVVDENQIVNKADESVELSEACDGIEPTGNNDQEEHNEGVDEVAENEEVGDEEVNDEVGDEEVNQEVGDEEVNEEVGDEQEYQEIEDEAVENEDVGDEDENQDVADEDENQDVGDEEENQDVGDEEENQEIEDEAVETEYYQGHQEEENEMLENLDDETGDAGSENEPGDVNETAGFGEEDIDEDNQEEEDNGSQAEDKSLAPALSLPKGYKFQTEVGGLFKCHKCPDTFDGYNLIKRHWTLVHGFRGAAHCVICLLPFPSRQECAAHRKNVHGFKCEDCGKEFKKEVGLRDHEKAAHAKAGTNWDCPHCSTKTSFKLKFQLIKHIQSQHENLTGQVLLHLCVTCKEKFLTESELNEHAVKHENPLSCTMCDEKFFGPRARAKKAIAYHMKEFHPDATSYPEGRRNSARRRGSY